MRGFQGFSRFNADSNNFPKLKTPAPFDDIEGLPFYIFHCQERAALFGLADIVDDADVRRVSTLLEGSIRKVGDTVRVTAQLINAGDGYHLWSETYDRPVKDIIRVQEEIAARIVERLQGGTSIVKTQPRSIDLEAHKLYLQARGAWNKRTEAGLRRAVQLFNQAIEKDPTYAEAYAGLAATYMVLPMYAPTALMREHRPLARAAANRSLELDPKCAEGHAVLASVMEFEQNFNSAEQHYQKAIQLDANYATAHHWYGRFLSVTGKRDAGMAELRKANDLDPLSPVIYASIAEWYYLGRQYDLAIEETEKVINTFPDFPSVRHLLVVALMLKGNYQDALAEVENARKLETEESWQLLDLKAFCLARSGQEDEARKILAKFEQLKREGKPVNGLLSFIYQGLRDYDKALELANEDFLAGNIEPFMLCEPVLDEVREMPQFKAFLARAGMTNAVAP